MSLQEESLSAGLDRRIDQFRGEWNSPTSTLTFPSNVQQQMTNFADDLSRLRSSCDKLKRQRSELFDECAAKELDKTALLSEIDDIKSERDALQLELATLLEEGQFLRTAEAATSLELEANGRLARQLWVQTEKVKQLEGKILQAEEDKRREVGAACEASRALKERIQSLESTRAIDADSALVVDLRHQAAVLQDEVDRIGAENRDLQDSIRAERKLSATTTKRIHALEEQLQAAQEEARHYKQLASDRDELEKKLKATNDDVQRLKADKQSSELKPSSARPLQAMSSNIISTPRTPTKAQPSSFDSVNHSQPTSPTSLARSYEYLQNRHRALKSQFDLMRAKYAKDIQHWKEFRAVHVARQELRHKKREQRKADSGQASLSGSVPPTEEGSAAKIPSSAEAQPDCFASNESVRAPMAAPTAAPTAPPTALAQLEESNSDESPAPEAMLPSARKPAPIASQSSPVVATVSAPVRSAATKATELRPTKATSAPLGRSSTTLRIIEEPVGPSRISTPATSTPAGAPRQPSRVTPWLGGSTRKSSSVAKESKRRRSSFSDEDDIDDLPIKRSNAVGIHTPLIRNRTGSTSTSLRKTALQKTVSNAHGADEQSDTLTTPDSGRKRLLNHEDLSPAQRAAERKRLARLPTMERREVYAAYKIEGRYLPPEEVQRTVADEFEIDPARNKGVGHRYHDVVRNRDERKQMHGGNCECCSDYYHAIGPLPRFNQGPIWKDKEDDEEGDGFHQLQDHRNRISRHREEHPRNPTPPDFWKIGFPSTQQVEEQNRIAAEMNRKREAELAREVAHKNSKWRKK